VLSLVLFTPRAPEGTDSKIGEDDNNNGGRNKGSVVGAVSIAHSRTPERGSENEYRQEEENAGNLKPENAADAAKGLQKSAQTAGKATGGFHGCLTPRSEPVGPAIDRALGVRGGRTGLAGGQALTRNTACHSQSNSKYAANGFRSHFDMMVTVGQSPRFAQMQVQSQLPLRLLWK
jgi:hypothetical protein